MIDFFLVFYTHYTHVISMYLGNLDDLSNYCTGVLDILEGEYEYLKDLLKELDNDSQDK